MKLRIKDPVVALDADGEPVGGRVSGVDEKNGTVTINPSVCGPVTVKLEDCHLAARADVPEAAAAPTAPAAAPVPPPVVPVEPV